MYMSCYIAHAWQMVLAHKPREEGSTAEHTKMLETSIYHHTYTFQVYISLFLSFKHFCVLCCVCSLSSPALYIVGTQFLLQLLCWSLYKHTNRFSEAANVHVLLYSSCLTDGLTTQSRRRKGAYTAEHTKVLETKKQWDIDLEDVRMMVYGHT